jgi:hypothetical protein
MKEKWNVRTKEGYKNTCSGKCEDQARKFFFPMKEVTDDEHIHNDSSSKELPELVENIIKSVV